MSDVIARIYAYDDPQCEKKYAKRVIEHARGTHRFVPAPNPRARSPTPELLGRYSRETTVEREEDDTKKKTNDLDEMNSIQLTFNDPTYRNGEGIMFGRNPNTCDIVLPNLELISNEHCYLTFDDKRRLVVRDRSINGTIVTYSGQGNIRKKKFTWIIGGDDFLEDFKVIVLELHERVKFQIVVPEFDVNSYAHMDNVARFDAQMEELKMFPIGRLGFLDRVPTLPHSEMASMVASTSASPRSSSVRRKRKMLISADHGKQDQAIRLEGKKLGSGGYGDVMHVWNVSTGEEYASKVFKNAKKFDWMGEVERLRALKHTNIVKLIDFFERREPAMLMEYVPCGNLAAQWKCSHFSHRELEEILVQSLAALEYLHGQKPQVVHRDIKPENILVQSRVPMHIKLSDFGLSKAGDSLYTFCGTPLYAAPEIFALQEQGEKRSYTAAVDVWSLGVTILGFGYGLPRYSSSTFHGPSWCQRLVRDLHVWEPDGFDVLYSMLVIAADQRASAIACRQHILVNRARRSAWVPINAGDATYPITYELHDEAISTATTVPSSYGSSESQATIVPHDGRSPGHRAEARKSGARARDQHPETSDSRSRSSSESDAPTIIQGQVWAPSSSSRKPIRSRDHERAEYAKPNPATTRIIAKRGRSSASDPTTTTSRGIRPRQRKKKNTAKSAVSERSLYSESTLNLFGQGWLGDPNCVGSSIAAMGQSELDWSSWNSRPGTHVPVDSHHADSHSDLNENPADVNEVTASEEHIAHQIYDVLHRATHEVDSALWYPQKV